LNSKTHLDKSFRVGVLPYHYEPDTNPYQKMVCDALENSGCDVSRIWERRWFPLDQFKKLELDIVHMDWLAPYYIGKNALASLVKRQTFLSRIGRATNTKKVWTVHNVFAHEKGENDLERRIIKKIIGGCDGLMFHTQIAKKIFSDEFDLSSISTALIPHGHYIDAYQNNTTRAAARQQLGIDSDSKVVLFFGRMRKYKGIEDLLEAFAKVCSLENDTLIVAGLPFIDYPVDEIREQAKRLGIKNFIFEPRHVKDIELQVFFNACDVVTLPFKNILNSGSLILAMSYGCNIVAPKIGSVPEVACEDAYWGYDPNDSTGLESSISAAISSPRKTEEVIAYTKDKFSWDKIGQQLTKFYQELSSSNG